MDCTTARLLLELALPRAQELDQAESALLEAHLAGCTECALRARGQRRVDEHLGNAMRTVPIPAGLREKLTGRIRADRTLRLRRQRLRIGGWVAAAAAVLFALGTWWSMRPLPILDLAPLHAEPLPRSAEEVERHFADRGVRTVAPPQFNFGLLAVSHLREFQGRSRVPYLLFLRDGEYAEVLILSASQFNRDATLDQSRIDSGGYTVEVRPHPEDGRVFYLIRHTGRSLDPFLTREGRPTT